MPVAVPSAKAFSEVPRTRAHVSASLDRLLGLLVDHLRERRGIVVLTGERGSGKTIALHQLAIDAAPGIGAAFLTATSETTPKDLYEAVLRVIGEPFTTDAPPGDILRAALARADMPYPALLIDDAEKLSPSALAALVDIAAPDPECLAVTVVLATSASPWTLLRGTTLRTALSGSIAITPLRLAEIEHLIRAQARKAQLPPDAFSPAVLAEIQRRSGGLPRAVMSLATAALEHALRDGRHTVELADLGPPPPERPGGAAIPTGAPEFEAGPRALRSEPKAPSSSGTDPSEIVIAPKPNAAPPPAGAARTQANTPRRRHTVALAGVVLTSLAALALIGFTFWEQMRVALQEPSATRLMATVPAANTPHLSITEPAPPAVSGPSLPAAPPPREIERREAIEPAIPSPPPSAPQTEAALTEQLEPPSAPGTTAGEKPAGTEPDVARDRNDLEEVKYLAAESEPVEEAAPAHPGASAPEPPISEPPPAPVLVETTPPPVVVSPVLAATIAPPEPPPVVTAQEFALPHTEPEETPRAAALDEADLTALFIEAEAAIRRALARGAGADHPAAVDAEAISSELRQSFEAFLSSLESERRETPTRDDLRAALERFLAENELVTRRN